MDVKDVTSRRLAGLQSSSIGCSFSFLDGEMKEPFIPLHRSDVCTDLNVTVPFILQGCVPDVVSFCIIPLPRMMFHSRFELSHTKVNAHLFTDVSW